MSDLETIRNLIARQAQLRDDNRPEEWVEAYAADGSFWGPDGLEYRGHEAMLEWFRRTHKGHWFGMHLLSQPAIEVDGRDATASTDVVGVMPNGDGGFAVAWVARYHDRFRRDDAGTWQYTERRIQPAPS
jgi:hypothetical protein